MKPRLEGCYTAIVTPFQGGRNPLAAPINEDALESYLKYVVSGPIKGIVIAGSTGSDFQLEEDEQIKLAKTIKERFGDNILKGQTLIAGCGSNSTDTAVKLGKRMVEEVGINHLLQIGPYGIKPSNDGIRQHYITIADEISRNNPDVCITMYDIAGRMGGKGITPEVSAELAQHPNIIGVKSASGLDRALQTIEATKKYDFFVISGDDGLTVPITKAGGSGVISVTSGIDPKRMARMTNLALEGRFEEAEAIDKELQPLYNSLFPTHPTENPSPNPVTTHHALQRLGFNVGYSRGALSMSPSLTEAMHIDDSLARLGLVR
jgi:4-hydroxy-tetrahydrodipicolinate synthase